MNVPGLLDFDPLEGANGKAASWAPRIHVDRTGDLEPVDPADFDVMVTTAAVAPTPWVTCPPAQLEARLGRLSANIAAAPIAAATLLRVLRIGETLDFEDALHIESLAYSTLLGGGEFRGWLDQRGPMASPREQARVEYAREGDCVTLTLATPENRNGMTAAMRDALFEALANVVEDPSEPFVRLVAKGRCFSTGGDLAEFGCADDLAEAHAIRTGRSCALLLHRLGARASVRVHGACIGSGIEIAAAAGCREAADSAFVQLPELSMGLIPGAGGTVSLPRIIGRHRTAWLALGGFRIGAREARQWGLFSGAAA